MHQRHHREQHPLIPGGQVIQHLPGLLPLLLQIVGHDGGVVVVGVLPPLPVGHVGLHPQQAVLHFPDGLIRGYRDNVDGQHQVAGQVRQIPDQGKEVFNGDIGRIMSVDMEERELTVRFDDRDVVYDATELDELVLAYATTIHKAQGSEYPIVVMPVLMTHYVMLQRNLIYTGITRAKKLLVIVGTRKTLSYAVRNVTVTSRNTKLCQRLSRVNTLRSNSE